MLINQFVEILRQEIYRNYHLINISESDTHFWLIYSLPLLRGCVIVGDMLMLRPLSFITPMSPVAQAAW